MKTLCNTKCKKFENKSIEIRYIGNVTEESVYLEKLEKMLDDFVDNHVHTNMIDNVRILRTICKNVEEKLLSIFYQDEKGSECVVYDNSKLILYEKSKYKEYSGYKIKYDLIEGMKLDYENSKYEAGDYHGVESVSRQIKEMMQQVYCLKSVKPIILDMHDKAIIEIYRLFYNENPDFCSKDIHIKVQNMMSILANFGICLGDDYDFSLMNESEIPVSVSLEQLINKLYPFGEVDIDEGCKLAKEQRQIIRIVGDCVRKNISNKEDLNKTLAKISKTLYVGRYCVSYKGSIKEIAEFTCYETDEVETSIKLVKSIENKINKQAY